ncbi:modular serine protease [Holotrichia oblita]|uniref:Modular serine protease n=1 Tax=Holotrichia oblita TaxID=644536 RepID=A0ACB9SJ11_HOLOL|nr:modular serine protease [Holotrichia oblita]
MNKWNAWYGTITLLSDVDLEGVWIRVLFDGSVDQLTTDFGEVSQKEGNQFLIRNSDYTLKAYTPHKFNFSVQFNANDGKVAGPRLTGFRLNAKLLCPTDRNSIIAATNVVSPTTTERIRPIADKFKPQLDKSTCGKSSTVPAAPLIVGGWTSIEGEWPWHSAIYKNHLGIWKYHCGGTIIAPNFILTAAHCVIDLSTGYTEPSINFLVYVGTTSLKKLPLSTKTAQVAKIHAHSKFSRSNYHNDIALLELWRPLEYDIYIKPICLWQGSNNVADIVGELGTVVGWGRDESKDVSDILKKAQMPVIANDVCLFSKPAFFSTYLNVNSYCAGFRNGTSVCNGDSGSGMVIEKPDGKGGKSWYIRGLASVSSPLPGTAICNPMEYMVFTDVAKYLTSSAVKFISLLIVCFTIILIEEISGEELESPCPERFVYDKHNTEPNKWYGTITLFSDADLYEVWVAITFDTAPLEIGNWFGDVLVIHKLTYLILNRKHRLLANIPLHIRFYAKYDPSKPVPRVVSIRLNARTFCPENLATSAPTVDSNQLFTNNLLNVTITTAPTEYVALLSARNRSLASGNKDDDFFPGDFSGFKIGPTGVESNVECGTLAIQPSPLIAHGQKTKAGEFPWHAALYHTRGEGLNYTCGGSLISRYHVLTAAHCVSKPISQKLLDADNLLVYLGKYYLKGWSNPGVQGHHVSKITRHPQYNSDKFANDIAVIRLSHRAEFSDYVRPICLWEGSKDIGQLMGKFGTVVGWGYDEHGKLSEELTMLNMPIVSKDVCIYSLVEFYPKFTTADTYCAGFINGTTTCNGDSGGGMVFQKNTKNPNKKVFHLRGLISLSVALQNDAKCDPKHYVVFTDVAKYLEFIEQAMTQ